VSGGFIPIGNKGNFHDVSADIMERVGLTFYENLLTAAIKTLRMN
jgi:hypothetical protein